MPEGKKVCIGENPLPRVIPKLHFEEAHKRDRMIRITLLERLRDPGATRHRDPIHACDEYIAS